MAGVWVAEEREKVDPAVENKARRAHSPGHRLLVCLMLGAVSHVLKRLLAGYRTLDGRLARFRKD